MIILITLFVCMIGAWAFSGFLGDRPTKKAFSAMFVATTAFLFWWAPMEYLELRGGIGMHPELDVLVRRLALIGTVFAVASVILAARNPTKSLWINTARVIGWGTLVLGAMTVLFAAP